MKRTLIPNVTALVGCGILAGITLPLPAADSASMQAALDRAVTRNKTFGGGVMRVTGSSGILWEGVSGQAVRGRSALMTPSVPFEIASITKSVTAATVMRLVEEKRLALTTPLSKLLPASVRTGFNSTITVRELLNHTSGLADYWTDGPKDRYGSNAFLRAFLANPNRFWTATDILAYARKIPPLRRGRFHYSDTNYVLLGLIIERLTKRPLHDAFREWVFNPLGMDGTWLTFREPRRGNPQSHRYEGSEDLTNVPRQSADWAGGGLVSTNRDLDTFLRGLANGRLFRNASTLATMLRTVPTGTPGVSYGLGLYVVTLDGGAGKLWGHDGHGNSFAYYWPERGISFTGTLNQTENDWWPLVERYLGGSDFATIEGPADTTFNASLSVGWDSLYVDRGVNILRNGGYGPGILWTDLNVTWNMTDEDFLTIDVWNAFATSQTSYKEFDVTALYTRAIGDFSVTTGYQFAYGYDDGIAVSHELRLVVDYAFNLGTVTFIPSASYYFNLGPDVQGGTGIAEAASSFLILRLDASIPVITDRVAIEPWTAFGVNFRYNTREVGDDETAPFTGPNNIEFGVAVPVRLTNNLTVSGFTAYTIALENLTGTTPNTVWGGGAVTMAF